MRNAAMTLVVLAGAAWARPPSILVHTGRVMGPGDELVDGDLTVEVCLYPERIGELAAVFCEAYDTHAYKGVYAVNIGEVPTGGGKEPLPEAALRDLDKLYMTVNINGDGESSPRLPLGSVIFALKAADADTLAGKPLAQHDIAWTQVKGVPTDLADGTVSWSEVGGKPPDLVDGRVDWSSLDSIAPSAIRTDGQIVDIVEAGAVNLHAGSTLNSVAISTGAHTTALPASAITYDATNAGAALDGHQTHIAALELLTGTLGSMKCDDGQGLVGFSLDNGALKKICEPFRAATCGGLPSSVSTGVRTLAAMQVYCDQDTEGGGWALALAYAHTGGQNSALVSGTPPTSPTAGYSHMSVAQLQSLNFSEIRLYCETSNHVRRIHFRTRVAGAVNYFSGTGSNSVSYWQSGFALLGGHTANIPNASMEGAANETGELRMTLFPFYKSSAYHWAIGAAGRWECDDYPNNADHTTLHQVWVR